MEPSPGDTATIEGTHRRKHVAVVGFGMVAAAFIEKILKYDIQSGRDEWEITVFGEEPYMAYNRVGLTQYFTQRSIEDLYLNPIDWYSSFPKGKLNYKTSDPVVSIDANNRCFTTEKGNVFYYDECVLATGSNAALPPFLTWDRFRNTQGSFVYRTIKDLNDIIDYATNAPTTLGRRIKKAAVIGGGLLGLEAAKALLELEGVDQVVLIEGDQWLLSRQLDEEGGNLVLGKVKDLGVEVHLGARVQSLLWDDKERINGLVLQGKGGEPNQDISIDMLVFAVGIRPRDALSKVTPLSTTQRPGGFIVDSQLRTNLANIYAIGECANYQGLVYGLIAPGVEMADVLAFNLTEGPHHQLRGLQVPDLSTKLKLMGVDVASFGDFFADKGIISKPLPGITPRITHTNGGPAAQPTFSAEDIKTKVKALTYRDPFSNVYKKYIFTADGKYLLGGMMVGDVKDYTKLVSICRRGTPIEKPPSQFIIGAKADGEEEGDDLPDDAQVCSCHNASKGAIVQCVKDGMRSFGEVKAATKCGTGCGGCVPLATSIFNRALTAAGVEISNHMCKDFAYSRQELYQIVKFRKLKDFTAIMAAVGGKPDSLGCEVCRPAIGSILSSVYNEWIMKPSLRQTQDTNDRYLANMQRDGTYSVVPRLPAGEITPDGLVAIGEVAGEFGLYTKITGGQRIDMFGAKKQDLPEIWEKLVRAGFESGHAYGKALRTVKSCVGSTWCRFGVGDSVGLAVELEQRYKGLRAPHKFKGGVSGCIRECAEAQGKDFGLIATSKGWNVYVGGNGGAKPRHAELLAENVTRREAVRILDRFIIFYIRTADKLERTARWIERYPGGLQGVKEVVVGDKLGICADLEQEMEGLVGTYHCEWTKVINNPKRRQAFKQFANTEETQIETEKITQRKQKRPADWEEESPLKFSIDDLAKDVDWEWRPICQLSSLDKQDRSPTSVTVKYGNVQLAIWNIPGRGLRAAQNMCPHRRAFVLADGLVGEDENGREYVSCPLHKRNYQLDSDPSQGGGSCSDKDYSIMTFEAKEDVENDQVLIKLPPTDVLDAVLATSKWMLHRATEESNTLVGGANHSVEIAEPRFLKKKGRIAESRVSNSCGSSSLEW